MAENVHDIAEAHVQGIDLDYRAPSIPESVKAGLPKPVFEQDAGWLDLYWRTWSIAFDKLRTPDPSTGLVSYCDAAFSHNIFQWDTCFMLRFLRYAPGVFHAYGSLDNFYLKQHDDGFICREINSVTGTDFWPKDHKSSINPPLFADAEWSLYCLTGDTDRIQAVLPPLLRYHEWLCEHRRAADGVGFWTNALGSGMDNSPRAHAAGGTDVHEDYGYTWVCMTAQMALSSLRICQLADVVGLSSVASRLNEEYETLRDYLRDGFWNEDLGCYADKLPDGSVSDVLTPATLWPLILPGEAPERVDAVEKALLDPSKLGRRHLVPSLSADHELYDPKGNYWRGSVWPPMVYLAVLAMRVNDRFDTARAITRNHLDIVHAVFSETGTFWENYAPDSIAPGQIARPEFVGWTGCGPIALLIEAEIGLDLDAATRQVRWELSRSDRHGIENLDFGNGKVSLIYEPGSAELSVRCDESFSLLVSVDERCFNFDVSPGIQRLPLK